MINAIIEQHKYDHLKASCLGADWGKENDDTELDVAKAELVRLRRELAEKLEKVAFLDEEMQN